MVQKLLAMWNERKAHLKLFIFILFLFADSEAGVIRMVRQKRDNSGTPPSHVLPGDLHSVTCSTKWVNGHNHDLTTASLLYAGPATSYTYVHWMMFTVATRCDIESSIGQLLLGERGSLVPVQQRPLGVPASASGTLTDPAAIPIQNRPPNFLESIQSFFQNLIQFPQSSRFTVPPSDPITNSDFSRVGLCSRQTCGDLYKILDNFQNNPFLNLFGFLLRSRVGLNLLGRLLTNPQILQTVLTSKDDPFFSLDGEINSNSTERKELNEIISRVNGSGSFYDEEYLDKYIK